MVDARYENRISIVTPEGVQLDLAVAGIASRMAARLLDSLIQGAIILALFMAMGVTAGAFGGYGRGWAVALAFLVLFTVLFLYDLIFEIAMQGQTPGKRATGIRVVDAAGGPASGVSIVLRNVLRIIDFLPAYYLIGFVSMLVTSRTQRLGDLAAHTIVVRERKGADAQQHNIAAGSNITVPASAVALWDVSAVRPEEVQLCREFLARRFTLPPDVRYTVGVQIASRVAQHVAGLPATSHPEYVIEGVVLAKELRS